MMTTRDHVEWLERHGGMVPATAVRQLLDEALAEDDSDRVYSTVQASERFGRTADYWQDAARMGKIQGAWRDSRGAPWNLPARGIRHHLARKQLSARSGRRGPYGKKEQAA